MGPPGVAHDTISIDRLGKAASSPAGEQVAEPSRTNTTATTRGSLEPDQGWQPRGRAAVRVRRDDGSVPRSFMRENMTVAAGAGHREGWGGRL